MINSVKRIANIFSKGGSSQIPLNKILPLPIKVLDRISTWNYTIQIGAQKMTTQSEVPLLVGGKYWGTVNRGYHNHLTISDMTKRPEILDEIQNFKLKFDLSNLEQLKASTPKSFMESYLDFSADKMLHATSKEEFYIFGNILLALKDSVFNLILNENGKNALLQFKPHGENMLSFSAIYNNLGPLNGTIYLIKDTQNSSLVLNMQTQFKTTALYLQNRTKNIDGFKEINISVAKNIDMLYTFQKKMIDINA